MSKRNIIGVIIILLAAFLVVLPVRATEGGGQSGEEFSGCNLNENWSIDTCVGAEWRYYETTSNRVVIKGKGDYAPGTTITGCGDVGGYWRYAMVAYRKSQYSDGTWYNPGDQVGITGMSGNSDSVFDSVYWNKDKSSNYGAMNYYCPSCTEQERTNKMNRDFARIKTEYEAAQREWPNIFTKGFNKNSDLAWFCAENPNAAEYSSESKVSNSTTNNYTNNSYTTSSIKKASDSNRIAEKSSTVNVGGTIYITFAHNVYANRKVTKNVKWKVTKSLVVNDNGGNNTVGFYYKKPGVYNDSRFTISAPAQNPSSGKKYSKNGMAPTVEENTTIAKDSGTTPGFMADGGYRDSSNSSSYVFRDYYRIKFVEAGTYKFCETISVDGTAITTACSKIIVKDISVDTECNAWIPNTYGLHKDGHVYLKLTEGTSSIVSKAKDKSTNDTWGDEVYAKPGDKVEWVHCYYPGAQMTAGMDVVNLVKKSGGVGGHGSHKLDEGKHTWNKYADYSALWDGSDTSGGKAWTNQLNLKFSESFGTSSHKYSGSGLTNGVTNNKYPTDGSNDSYMIRKIIDKPFDKNQVSPSHVGKTFEEWGETGFPVTAKVTNEGRNCSPLDSNTCQHLNDYLYGGLSGDSASSAHAKVLVPYNFKNEPTVNLGNVNLYAGEKTNIAPGGIIKVRERENATTGGIGDKAYATRVDNAKIKVVGFLSDTNLSGSEILETTGNNICETLGNPTGCTRIDQWDNENNPLTLNGDGALDGGPEYNLGAIIPNITADIPDVPAGKYYCVALAVYPAHSGRDTMMDTSGSNTWAVSKPSCTRIAKKPSIQIWGAGLYTADDLRLSLAQKHNIVGQNLEEGESIAFGSWVEQNVVALGEITDLASGAANGLAGSFTSRTKNGLDGSYGTTSANTICILNPLTMPNKNCSSGGKPGTSGGSSNSAPSAEEQEELIKPYVEDGGGDVYELHKLDTSGRVEIKRDGKERKSNVCEFTNPSSFDKTQVYTCEGGTIVIRNDIEYPNKTYSSLEKVPKIIIYAKEDIWIGCAVKRIDAVLIAGGTVDDCYESFSTWVNDRERSNQLTINGSIIADMMIARRTYGGATGKNSSVPAEIVNYDTSLYLWSFSSSERSSSKNLKVDYQVELPPRL